MAQMIEYNEGEVVVNFTEAVSGKVSFKDLGIDDKELKLEGGFFRLVLNMDNIQERNYFAVPTIEVSYLENVGETHWQCDFNGQTILDKTDNHGNSTVILLNRDKLSQLEHHHENELVIHGEFPKAVQVNAEASFINLFK